MFALGSRAIVPRFGHKILLCQYLAYPLSNCARFAPFQIAVNDAKLGATKKKGGREGVRER